jgi:hypothetical protein
MRVLAVFVVLCSCFASADDATKFNDRVLCAEWGSVQNHWFGKDWYQYLRINDDFSGVLTYSYGNDPVVLKFGPQDVQHEAGLVVISLNRPNGPPFRLALAGWRIASGEGLATGTLFIYDVEGGREYLVNSIPIRVEWLVLTGLPPEALPDEAVIRKGLTRS